MTSTGKPLRIVAYDATWPARFEEIGTALRARLGEQALRIDHIGSSAVSGLAAKDVIDLRADATAAGAYGLMKTALAKAAAGDWDTYYAIKDPACDLIIAGAEQWSLRTAWTPGPSDA